MSDLSRRPWLDLYRDVPPTIVPPAETGLDMFRATARRGRDAVLAHYFDQPVTVQQCDVMSDALAVDLQRRGVEPGDRVAMYLQNIPQVLITVLAAWKCGAGSSRKGASRTGEGPVGPGSRIIVCQEDLFAEVARARPVYGGAAHDHHLAARLPAAGAAAAGTFRRDPGAPPRGG
jgi:long-chain acyl-CoA synthetase